MNVVELWRYPVKSMGGERLDRVAVDEFGLDGDRRWGLRDNDSGRVLTAKIDGRLLHASAWIDADGGPVVELPTGARTDSSATISDWLQRSVTLEAAGEEGGHFANPRDFENETDFVEWQGPPVAWHDMKRARVSLVGRPTMRNWDVRRFRPNVVLDAGGEDELVGRRVCLGGCELSIEKQLDRCVMVTRSQPGLERDLDVLRTINRERATFLAVGALVCHSGEIAVGDLLEQIS